MTEFERNLSIIIGGLIGRENDPKFGYRVYRLPKEDQARIFQVARAVAKSANDTPPPTTGVFVSAAMHPELKQICLAFSRFPKEGGPSVILAMLAYDVRELNKAMGHITNYLTAGFIPVADEEYAAA